jgi:hypothetical protein
MEEGMKRGGRRRERKREAAALEALRKANLELFQLGYDYKDDGLLALHDVVAHCVSAVQRRLI